MCWEEPMIQTPVEALISRPVGSGRSCPLPLSESWHQNTARVPYRKTLAHHAASYLASSTSSVALIERSNRCLHMLDELFAFVHLATAILSAERRSAFAHPGLLRDSDRAIGGRSWTFPLCETHHENEIHERPPVSLVSDLSKAQVVCLPASEGIKVCSRRGFPWPYWLGYVRCSHVPGLVPYLLPLVCVSPNSGSR